MVDTFNTVWLDNLPVMARVSDSTGACVYVNNPWQNFTGNVLNHEKGDGWKQSIHPDDKEKYLENLKSAIKEGKEYSFELRLKKKNGDYHWFVDSGKPLYDPLGKYVLFVSVYTDVSNTKKHEEELNSSLEGKEVLLREIHHRVKNNMAVVAGMLDLHMDYVNSPSDREIFLACQSRVLSMALIHEKLYRSETLSKINFKNYIEDLVKKVRASYMDRTGSITVKIEADNTELDLERAMPCGLILNELITNAFKHAFNNLEKGEIIIGFFSKIGKYTLFVSDNGIGIEDDSQLNSSATLGYTLVAALTKQLDAMMEVDKTKGLMVKFTF
ncbi:MAG TPA: histidine kinase dimerization/phosphoacceptor domain -containing protein [Cytophagaceae bacterium]|jgi:PAS domain S-box-containing protein|nr:histidine kinase dimerization/phosphoacceptor domain -containing protein [Cytophagaceae bacterium]